MTRRRSCATLVDVAETVEEVQYNKAHWAPGEWQNEPDRKQWHHAGFACLAIRSRLGSWCGYVGVPEGHPAFGQKYSSVDVDVHGELTYADRCAAHICHVPEPGFPTEVWWLGFDCGHFMDWVPGVAGSETMRSTIDDFVTYKTIEFVTAETERLAEQLAELEQSGELSYTDRCATQAWWLGFS